MLIRILCYFIPIAINFLTGGFLFITAYRFAQAGCSGTITAGALTAWGVAYCIFALLVGRIVKPGNTLPLIFIGSTLLAVTAAGLAVCSLYMQYFFLILAGLGSALFCAPFQLFAKSLEASHKNTGAVAAAAFYTFTWSIGFASGSLAFSRFSIAVGHCLCLGFALAVLASVALIVLLRPQKQPSAPTPVQTEELPQTAEYDKRYDKLAFLGWIVGCLGTVTVCQFRGIWPKLGEELTFPREHVALIFALASYSQGIVGLLLCRSKIWMYRSFPALLLALTGIGSLAAFAFCHTLWCFYVAAIFYGAYCGCFYFYLVHNSLAHPTRSSFYIVGNEVIVGITCIFAPLAGGILTDLFKSNGAAFIFAASVAAAIGLIQLCITPAISGLQPKD